MQAYGKLNRTNDEIEAIVSNRQYGQISFGANATDKDYAEHGLFPLVNIKPELKRFEEYSGFDISFDGKIIKRIFKVVPMEEDRIIKKFEKIIQEHLDKKAQDRGYKDIFAASIRASLPNSPYHEEGVAYGEWMDEVWSFFYSLVLGVKSKKTNFPDNDSLIARLPTLKIQDGGDN